MLSFLFFFFFQCRVVKFFFIGPGGLSISIEQIWLFYITNIGPIYFIVKGVHFGLELFEL